ncbi:MAG: hypothetical protein AB7I35_01670 [Ramlibacter sp.]
MTDADLDRSYTALCEAMARVGEAQTPLLLSMVCLSLMSRLAHADEALPLIDRAMRELSPALDAPARHGP